MTDRELFAWTSIRIESELVNANRGFALGDPRLEKVYAFIGWGLGCDRNLLITGVFLRRRYLYGRLVTFASFRHQLGPWEEVRSEENRNCHIYVVRMPVRAPTQVHGFYYFREIHIICLYNAL
jgi:hypothetical protein